MNLYEAILNIFLPHGIAHAVNCLDRHVAAHPERVAIIWEKDEPNQEEKVTYKWVEQIGVLILYTSTILY